MYGLVKWVGTLIDVNSDSFVEIVNQCRFSMLLSYGEGLPISIVSSMKAGLIPIISDQCGSSFGDIGLTVPYSNLLLNNYIPLIDVFVNKSQQQLIEMSRKSKLFAFQNFNPSTYINDILHVLEG